MKYKVLITGNNGSVIDDFFDQMTENFDILSSSTRYMDLLQHINYFQPDIFVYCASREAQNSFTHGTSIKAKLKEQHIPFVLIASRTDCEEFIRTTPNAPDLILYRPLSSNSIQEKIIRFLEEKADNEQGLKHEQALAQFLSMVESTEEEPVEEEPVVPLRKHILVVDDDPMMLKLIKEHLHEDYDVATAVNGKIALKFLERRTTDLILLDYEMPTENGPAILEKLRAEKSTKDIPVIFLTGVKERDKIHTALSLKPQGYLLKPIDHKKLLEAINKILQ
ncbi:MAG: response regulator [Acetatifactor sp.]|nr:response regulator [Acetatifactor sp.]